ncbi:MAG: winged helix-turn-helix domain-containing protein [Pirellulales bacterium]
MSAKKTTKTTAAKKPATRKKAKAPARTKKPKTAGKLSALDAAAKVLAESGEPMTTRDMIEAMASKGYWTSPAGATPDRTLYSAVLREINTKGKDARFVKTERGRFAAKK